MRGQRIVIAVPLEESLLNPLYEWGKNFDFTHVESIHFLHIVKINITPLEFGLIESPDESTFLEMAPTIKRFLQEEAEKIIPKSYQGEIDFQVTKDFHSEEAVIDVLKKKHATLIVVATRGKHGFDGLFHSSFTDYMVKFAPCDVFVVRPAKDLKKWA